MASANGSNGARRPWAPRVLLAVLTAVIAAELGARGWDAVQGVGTADYLPREIEEGLYVPHPYLGVVLRPGFVRRGPFAVTVGSRGLRGPDRPVEKGEGVYRIVCLGGSTTFGTGVSADEHAYPAQLERMLNTLPEGSFDYEVWNAGVPGYTTHESLINFALRVCELEPDAVIVYHAVNDARPIQAEPFASDYAHFRTPWKSVVVSDTERFLLRASRIYAWLAPSGQRDVSLGELVVASDYVERMRSVDDGVNEAGVATFQRNLRHLAALVQSHGASLYLSTFATCPERRQPEDDVLQGAVERLNAEIRATGNALDVPVFEIDGLSESGLYTDWVHFNDAGSNRHARTIVMQARANGWLGLPVTQESETPAGD